jgi:Nucleolar protein,Nop52
MSIAKRLSDADPGVRAEAMKAFKQEMLQRSKKRSSSVSTNAKSGKNAKTSAEPAPAPAPEPVTLESLTNIWTSLWYTLWMADKDKQEIAIECVAISDSFDDKEFLIYLQAFSKVAQLKWNSLDKWRMDKYLLMFRVLIAEIFKRIRVASWSTKFTTKIIKVLQSLLAKVLGLGLQFARVFWEELNLEIARDSQDIPSIKDARETAIHLFIKMSVELALSTQYETLTKRICEDVIQNTPKVTAKKFVKTLGDKARGKETDQSVREILYKTIEIVES